MRKHRSIVHGITFITAFALVLSIFASSLCEKYATQIDGTLGTHSYEFQSSDDGSLYSTYVPPETFLLRDSSGAITGTDTSKLVQYYFNTAVQTTEESVVLLKNENNTLPLSNTEDKNITLLGVRSYYTALSGGVAVIKGHFVTLPQALSTRNKTDFSNATYITGSTNRQTGELTTDSPILDSSADISYEGGGFNINPTVQAAYEAYNETAKLGYTLGSTAGENIKEADIDNDIATFNGFTLDGYKDAAIVTVSRGYAENGVYTRGSGENGSEPLALTTNERRTIEYATENFEKVIVLVNTTNPMEIDELKNSRIFLSAAR